MVTSDGAQEQESSGDQEGKWAEQRGLAAKEQGMLGWAGVGHAGMRRGRGKLGWTGVGRAGVGRSGACRAR